MANRLRVTSLITLALLNLSVLGSGAAAAVLLPARLALWQIPRVTGAPLAAPPRVLGPLTAPGTAPTSGGLAAALAPLLSSRLLGPDTGAVVADLRSGRVLFSSNGTTPATPASTAKLGTAIAALSVLGPRATFTTRVVQQGAGSIVLVGGGDPTLAAGHPPASDYPQPATLASLAGQTARWLRAHGHRSVRLGYDTSLFTGPTLAPGWPIGYITTGNVTPITSLEVDQGRLTPSGAPQNADDPLNFRPRSFTPAQDAASAFAAFLAADGIRVSGAVTQVSAPASAATVAAVHSPPLSAIVEWMLRESNNVIAEGIARHVALRLGAPASFSGAAETVTGVLRSLGVRTGISMVDSSGLSPEDRIAPAALARLVALAAAPRNAALRPVLSGLPVAGFSGTLASGQSVFGDFGPAALGSVRAKTGNLSTVVSLAGLTTDSSGRVLVFAFMADRVPASYLTAAAGVLDQMATALAGCGCH